jgi:thiosulfate reductase cytochrome b subunit
MLNHLADVEVFEKVAVAGLRHISTRSFFGRTDRAAFGEPLFIWLGCGVFQEPRMQASAARERETTGPREFAIGRSITVQLQRNCKSQAMSIEATHEQALTPAAPTGAVIHPLWVRLTHWVNAVAMVVMIGSGWQIYNASPLFAFLFPPEITLGGWLAGALLWHFAAMWLLVVNGLVYLVLGIATGRFLRKLVQKLLYLGVILAGIVIVLSGLAIWKPVQLQELAAAFGGYDAARYVHFFAMAAIVGFLVVHVVMALLVPKSLRAMITGR